MLRAPSSPQLLHNDPITLNVVQIELDRCGSLRRGHVRGLDRPENFAVVAQQNDAPAAGALDELRVSLTVRREVHG